MEDLFSDLCDGRRLLELLEGLSGHELVRTHAHTHMHKHRGELYKQAQTHTYPQTERTNPTPQSCQTFNSLSSEFGDEDPVQMVRRLDSFL